MQSFIIRHITHDKIWQRTIPGITQTSGMSVSSVQIFHGVTLGCSQALESGLASHYTKLCSIHVTYDPRIFMYHIIRFISHIYYYNYSPPSNAEVKNE
jgi:hypothetical protein